MSEVETFLTRERDRFEEIGSENEFTATVDGTSFICFFLFTTFKLLFCKF